MPQISRHCPICNTVEADTCLVNTMAAVGGFDLSYTVVRCICCGFHYANRLADPETFDLYYQAVSKYDAPGVVPPVDQARISATIRFLEERIPKSDRIADLGCGYGALLGGLKSAGWQHLEGIDPAPNAAQCALDMFGISGVQRGTMSQAHKLLELQTADLVCIMCVLEHLPDLRKHLSQLLSKLKPGCKLLIEVPAVECFPHPRSEPYGEFSLEHIQFFNMPSLANLMKSLGAKVLSIELMELPMVFSGDMLGLFEWSGVVPKLTHFESAPSHAFEEYLMHSHKQLHDGLQKIPAGPLIIYGAGSHTARLLARLEEMPGCSVQGIVDSNPNLNGKKMGRWTVRAPDSIAATPSIPVLISSFRSQNAIAAQLKETTVNPLVLMYDH